MVDSCLHCKFRNGAWRPRAAFQDRVLSFEDRIIYIDGEVEIPFLINKHLLLCWCNQYNSSVLMHVWKYYSESHTLYFETYMSLLHTILRKKPWQPWNLIHDNIESHTQLWQGIISSGMLFLSYVNCCNSPGGQTQSLTPVTERYDVNSQARQ